MQPHDIQVERSRITNPHLIGELNILLGNGDGMYEIVGSHPDMMHLNQDAIALGCIEGDGALLIRRSDII